MSRFKVGQKVWIGRGKSEREVVVARVVKNPLIPIRQYEFEAPHDGALYGEQSIRDERDGRDLRLGECFVDDDEIDDDVATRMNTTSMMTREPIRVEEFGVEKALASGNLFFRPNREFCEWLRDYADGRMIIDVGAGQGHLVRMLEMAGAGVIGLEPNFDMEAYISYAAIKGMRPNINQMLPMTVQSAKNLINGMGKGNKALLVFARPCHSDFVEIGIENMPDEMEALYITVPENIERYRDLGKFHGQAVLLEHKGISEDNEVVYSIRKK